MLRSRGLFLQSNRVATLLLDCLCNYRLQSAVRTLREGVRGSVHPRGGASGDTLSRFRREPQCHAQHCEFFLCFQHF